MYLFSSLSLSWQVMANLMSPYEKPISKTLKLTAVEIESPDKDDDPDLILEKRRRLVQVVKELDSKKTFHLPHPS